MKHILKNITLTGVAVMALGGLYSCTQDFEDINTDPNKLVVGQLTPYNMFESLLYGAANNRYYDAWYYSAEIVQHTATNSTNSRISTYTDLNNKFFDRTWSRYANEGANAVHMYDLAVKDMDEACQAIALTIKVMAMEELTAAFGDIPYREAFQARKTGNVKPVFDPQKEVYEQMFADLDSANNLYAKNPKFDRTTMDGMYGGDMNKWRRFNNSLYLRLLCRVSGRAEMNVGAKITEIMKNPSKYPIITSNAQNATVTFTGTTPYANYFYNTAPDNFSGSHRMSQQMVKLMTVTETAEDGTISQDEVDPRTDVWFYKYVGTTYNPYKLWIGAISGGTPAEMDEYNIGTSGLSGAVLCGATVPITLLEYAEIQMIFAEMAHKGIIEGGDQAAKSYYESAIRASLDRWSGMIARVEDWGTSTRLEPFSTDVINEFMSSSLASWDQAANKDELIGNQKYLLLFYNGFQAFHEIHRTGYPVLKMGGGTGSNNYTFPTRFSYPTNTIGTNPDNANAAIKRQGWSENNMRQPLWYSRQAIESGK